jgi:hypothetical protein
LTFADDWDPVRNSTTPPFVSFGIASIGRWMQQARSAVFEIRGARRVNVTLGERQGPAAGIVSPHANRTCVRDIEFSSELDTLWCDRP